MLETRCNALHYPGGVTITTETSTDDATALPRMNLSGYVGRATIFR